MPITQRPKGFSKYGLPLTSHLANNGTQTSAVDFEMQNEVQGKTLSRVSQYNFKRIISLGGAFVTKWINLQPGSVAAFSVFDQFDPPDDQAPVFTFQFVSLYQQTGTVTFLGTAQFYPALGAGVGPKDYFVSCFYDYHQLNNNFFGAPISGYIRNDTNSGQTIVGIFKPLALDYFLSVNP